MKPAGKILTAATSASTTIIKDAYDLPTISKYLDYILVMTYDRYRPNARTTGINAPLYDTKCPPYFSVKKTLQYYQKEGVPMRKIALGIAFFEKTYTLMSRAMNGVGDEALGDGAPGPILNQPGILGYNEVTLVNNFFSQNLFYGFL